jgi:hypothetical protein
MRTRNLINKNIKYYINSEGLASLPLTYYVLPYAFSPALSSIFTRNLFLLFSPVAFGFQKSLALLQIHHLNIHIYLHNNIFTTCHVAQSV